MTDASRKQVLLVIDDNPANLQVAVRLLEAYSLEVLTARDGESGIGRAARTAPDLILLDVRMPGIDGYETCRRLKAAPETADCPVIFMTAMSSTDDKLKGFEVGAVDYVTKPFEAAELLARVQTHLSLRALRSRLAQRNDELEERVAERTEALRQEFESKQLAERQREQLLEMSRVQCEQLRSMTRAWMAERGEKDKNLADTLNLRVTERLNLLRSHIERAAGVAEALDEATGQPMRAALQDARELLDPLTTLVEDLGGDLSAPGAPPVDMSPLLALSSRETEVLQLLTAGKSNKEIAWTLDVARTTVSTYRMRLLEKLEVNDTASLIRLAVRAGLAHQPLPGTQD